jgi:hypothetical protein
VAGVDLALMLIALLAGVIGWRLLRRKRLTR